VLVVVTFHLRPRRQPRVVVGRCRGRGDDCHVLYGQHSDRRKAQRRASPGLGNLQSQHPDGLASPA